MLIKTTDTKKTPSGRKAVVPAKPATAKGKPPFASISNQETCPLRKLIREWIYACEADGLSPKTIVDYKNKLFKFSWWWTEHTHYAEELGAHPRNVTVKEARAFAAYLREPNLARWGINTPKNNMQRENLSAASVASYGRTIKTFFSWIEREEHIDRSPFNKSVHFTNRHKQDRIIKRVETIDLELIFQALTEPKYSASFIGCRNLAIFSLMLDTGIRRGEVVSMRLCDVDLERSRFSVTGKTGSRYAPLSRPSRESLARYIQHREFRQILDLNNQPDMALWLTVDGEKLSYYGFGMVIKQIEKRSGVNFHAHKLRHTFASLMASEVGVFDLKELMGHSSITTTEIYVQKNPERLAEVHRQHSPLNTLSLGQHIKKGRGRPRNQEVN